MKSKLQTTTMKLIKFKSEKLKKFILKNEKFIIIIIAYNKKNNKKQKGKNTFSVWKALIM